MVASDDILTFSIEFLGPFRVSTGYAKPGVDNAVDPADPLPSTSLKGVMRGTARQLLGAAPPLIDEVFGSARVPSPWSWSNAKPDGTGWSVPQLAARVRIDERTHTAAHDMIGIAEQTWAPTACFTVTQVAHVGAPALHRTLLALAACGTRSLGANRRRGLGWVSITCADVSFDDADLTALLETGTAS